MGAGVMPITVFGTMLPTRDILLLEQMPVGSHGAITDVAGVRVGHASVHSSELYRYHRHPPA